ncbi:MAG: amidohydrolase family protein, partial [Acidobacteriaceae bacterium]|nr:amidohydrolase family protein [Acidobacteriaceae bacterium]
FTHTVTLEKAKIAARAGVDVLAHGVGNAAVDDELIELLRAKGTFYVSTLAVYEPRRAAPVPARALLLLDPEMLRATQHHRTENLGPEGFETTEARQRRWKFLIENIRRLHQAGIPIAVGTDAGIVNTFHGYSTLREMELLVQGGLSPLEAITAGTGVSARALSVNNERGTISPGKVADLVLTDGNPDQRIEDIEKTTVVLHDGKQLSPRDLEASIQSNEMTPLPTHPAPSGIDNAENRGRTSLNTLRVDSTDPGVNHSRMMFVPVVRNGTDHSIMIEAQMGPKANPYTRLELPLTQGAVELLDATPYQGVSFDARGQCRCRVLLYKYGVRTRGQFAAAFAASGEWQNLRIPFSSLRRDSEEPTNFDARDLRAVAFELAGPAGSTAWLEIDNVRFY